MSIRTENLSSTLMMINDFDFPDSVLLDEHRVQQSQQFRSSLPLDVMVYVLIALLVVGVWKISKMGLFEAGDDTGYWIGVVGGVMMLLLFTYPLRKHFNFARNWGRVKWWFLVHMLLGIGGPLLILLHSTFRVGSLNAAVALYSMIAVAVSGVIGRFIYARVNRGLNAEQISLRDLKTMAGLQKEDARSRLSFAPTVQIQLVVFEDAQIRSPARWSTYLRQVFWLPIQQWLVYRRCTAEVHEVLLELSRRQCWLKQDLLKREVHTRKLIRRYLNAVTRVAQFRAYERLFSLWHVAHIPFVYLLVISAVVHVVAVHAY